MRIRSRTTGRAKKAVKKAVVPGYGKKGIENIEIAKEPLYTTKPNLERSGMGFTIMESFMDDVIIESVVGDRKSVV